VFNLGANNSVNGSTTLQGSTNGQQLHVVNSNAGSAATGISIQTDSNRPPLAVSSQTKVAKLNVDLLDGVDSAALEQRVAGGCTNGTAVARIDAEGTVACTTTAVFAIHDDIVANRSHTTVFAPAGLSLSTECHVGAGAQPAGFTFHAGDDSGGTLNWMFSRGGATSLVDANGAALGAGGELPVVTSGTPRIEGQFIWAEAHDVITLTLHFLDLSGRCELTGTAEVSAL
jgi:hypothetical protein